MDNLDEHMRLERLQAHRELQFLRAASSGKRRYVKTRWGKLQEVNKAIERREKRQNG